VVRTEHTRLTARDLLALQGQKLAHGLLLIADRAHRQRVGQDGSQMGQRLGLDVAYLGAAGEIGKGIKGVGHGPSWVIVLQG
jgi:hypothetical protein